ncbi:hypothetical protein FBU59_000534 [Linderina macrospora]|uniref:Uncharacterized protein n=1 Tax=Linderina macrospora TaxID=4868 RepID=A0ACC1JGN9_9FUNG|nr:hypothetical protein FBU59_000534 [Linderina macrospora]
MGFFDSLLGKKTTVARSCPCCASHGKNYGEYWRHKTPLTFSTHCSCAPTNGHQCPVKSHYDVYECTTTCKKVKPKTKAKFSLFPKSSGAKKPKVAHHHHYNNERPATSYVATHQPKPTPLRMSADDKVYLYMPGDWRISKVNS